METAQRLKNLVAKLVLRYNYWGYLFSRIKRQPDPNLFSIMSVGSLSDGNLCLFYNPSMVENTEDSSLLKVIEHEGMHILNKHISRYVRIMANEVSEEKKRTKLKTWNIACDCTVNCQAKLPDKLQIDGHSCQLCFPKNYNLPDNKIAEWYYIKLLESHKDISESNLVICHDKWQEGCKNTSDLSSLSRKIDQHIRQVVKESVKTFSKERGNLPSYITTLVQETLAPPKAPYYQIIKKLVRGTRFSKFQRSPTKINRKRMYSFILAQDDKFPQISPFPGKTRDFTFNIVVLIDTSGSMSVDDIKEGLSGLKNIIENDRFCRTTVLEVDSVIEKEYICKKIKDIQFNIKGRGGTTLTPGLVRAKQLKCDVCLAFTDGYVENINLLTRKNLPNRIIWVINKDGTSKFINKTGFVVKI